MGQTAQQWAGRIKRIDRAGFWRFVTKYFNWLARLARGIRGAYCWGVIGDGRSSVTCFPMTPIQMQTLRQLHAVRKAAQNAYHACLRNNAPDAERHSAEVACSAAVKAIAQYSKGL